MYMCIMLTDHKYYFALDIEKGLVQRTARIACSIGRSAQVSLCRVKSVHIQLL